MSLRLLDEALDQLKRQAGAKRLHLVGFSGGGQSATLLAARRSDIASIKTVAGALDLRAIMTRASVLLPPGSLDPVRLSPTSRRILATIPQIHFVGTRDAVVPPAVAASFVQGLPEQGCAYITAVDASHGEGWDLFSARITGSTPTC